ncbi:MAG TPA: 2-dehydropantoate 2-reductase N-terminal domain-containing protein [Candidatus Limnocylindrales bacterium]|nr:2-dehydropantoate 2-reductase N-terminal domain-containing protein [Candidatus Limnocylindrales bacterium]
MAQITGQRSSMRPVEVRVPEQTDPLRVVVVGPGAVGSFLGGMLAAAGHEVALLGRRIPEGVDRSRLIIEEPAGARVVPVRRIVDPADAGAPELVLLAVKMFDLETALDTAVRWPEAPLMTVQNGAGAEEAARARRTSPLLAGSLTTAVEPATGGVRRLRMGGMGIAAVPGAGAPAAAALAQHLAHGWTAAGLPTRVYGNAAEMKWSKVLANLVGNATSAILDMDPGAIYADRLGYHVERTQIREMVAVMNAMGLKPVALPGAHVSALLAGLALPEPIGRQIVARAVAGARGGKRPSLRLHVRGGGPASDAPPGSGPTEARWLNGAVADAGMRVGVPAPCNAALARLVDDCASDPERAAFFAGRPDRLAQAIAAPALGS